MMQTIRVNLKNNAPTQYTNFDYNSMCVFNGVSLGAGPKGLFKLTSGDSDNGINIDAYFKTTITDFGRKGLKRLWYMIVGIWCSESVQVEVTYDNTTTSLPVAILPKVSNNRQHVKVALNNKSIKHSYSQCKFSNINGSDFTIDSVRVASASSSQSGY